MDDAPLAEKDVRLWMTPAQAAAKLQISETTVYRMIEKKRLRAKRKPGAGDKGPYLIHTESVNEQLKP